eukprot:8695803-Pyramimonas_sp.AAC.1
METGTVVGPCNGPLARTTPEVRKTHSRACGIPGRFQVAPPTRTTAGEPLWPGRRPQNPPGGPRLGTTAATTAAGA